MRHLKFSAQTVQFCRILATIDFPKSTILGGLGPSKIEESKISQIFPKQVFQGKSTLKSSKNLLRARLEARNSFK